MKDIGKISVILPCYKSETYVGDMISDMQAQTYSDWELVVVSNGDGQNAQLSVINKYAQTDNRIKVFSVSQGGVSNARNIGMDNTTGSWLAFVDADDRLDKDHLEKFANGTRDDVDIVIGGYCGYRQRGGNNFMPIKIEGNHGFDSYLMKQDAILIGAPWTKLIRASVLKTVAGGVKFDTQLTFSEDEKFFFDILQHTKRINTIPLTGYRYFYIGTSSTSMRYHECLEFVRKTLFDTKMQLWKEAGISDEEINKARENQLYISTFFLVNNLFKIGSPLSFTEKKDNIKRLIYNEHTFNIIKNTDRRNHNKPLILFDFLTDTKSPLFITLTYSMIYLLRNNMTEVFVRIRDWLLK